VTSSLTADHAWVRSTCSCHWVSSLISYLHKVLFAAYCILPAAC
jgi:hypothetical protein